MIASAEEPLKEGLTSYLGLMTRGFPNFFWINGPHSQFYNPILLAEFQCDLIFGALNYMDDNGKKILEATEENEQGWVDLTNQIGNMTLFPNPTITTWVTIFRASRVRRSFSWAVSDVS